MNRQPAMTRLILAAAAALALAACSQEDSRTAGEKLDAAVAKTEQKMDQAAAEVKQESAEAKAALERGANSAAAKVDQAAGTVADKTADAMITAAVNAELAKDNDLSALKIDVDTRDGRVMLSGTAPSASARDRASLLASAVKGVSSVDNRLEVRS